MTLPPPLLPSPRGVPQGSTLGPPLFFLYLLLFSGNRVSFHHYADDCQVYFPVKHFGACSVQPLLDCLIDIRRWMALQFFSLMRARLKSYCLDLTAPAGPSASSLVLYEKSMITNLDVKMDPTLNFRGLILCS